MLPLVIFLGAGLGGVARYENDTYYGHENPWIICTLWLAEAHLLLGRPNRTRDLIEWSARTASPTHLLAEQLDALLRQRRRGLGAGLPALQDDLAPKAA